MESIKKIVEELYPFDYSVASEGSDKSINVFKKHLNFKIHKFRTGLTLNSWKIPKSIRVKEVKLSCEGKTLIDTKSKNYSVISQCKSVNIYLNYDQLLKNLYYSEKINDAIPYGWTGLYNNKDNWGLCVSRKFIKKLNKNKKYHVIIKTEVLKNNMNVLEYKIKGKSDKAILINAHNCHPFQANDDISGCAVGISIFKELKKIRNLNYSYILLIAPEMYGPMFWLKKNKTKIIGSILLKSVGNDNVIKLQKSFRSDTTLDKVFLNLIKKKKNSVTGSFRELHGNDETVFEAPGHSIPSATLTRMPFKEYHTNKDTPKLILEKKLLETKQIVLDAIKLLDNNFQFKNLKKGLVCLSSQKYQLYIPPKQPGILKDKEISKENVKWNIFMNTLPLNIEKGLSLIDLHHKFNLDYEEMLKYLLKWKKKKLITFLPKKDLI